MPTLYNQKSQQINNLYVGDDLGDHDYINASMLFPDDSKLRQQYTQLSLLKKRAKELKEINAILDKFHTSSINRPAMGARHSSRFGQHEKESLETGKTPIEEAIDLIKKVQSLEYISTGEVERKYSECINHGLVAGSALMFFHTLENGSFKTKAQRRAEPSLNIVTWISEWYNLGRPRRKVGQPPADKKGEYPTLNAILVKNTWRRYQPVSHLWAAYIHCGGTSKAGLAPNELLDGICASKFLATALYYEEFILRFFNGGKVGRSQRDNFQPIPFRYDGLQANLVSHISSPPEMPESILSAVQKLTAEYSPASYG